MDDTRVSRRQLLSGAAGALAATAAAQSVGPDTIESQEPALPPVPADPTKVPGSPTSQLGARSRFEKPRRTTGPTSTQAPLQDLVGTITPSDVHYERHHAGVPTIDPAKHTLTIHGLVDRPMVFTVEDLKRFPSISRTYFLECSGNYRRNAAENDVTRSRCVVSRATANGPVSRWRRSSMKSA